MKRILLDMSATIIHHGHVRLIKNAKKLGKVIIGLTRDSEIKKYKGYIPELRFKERREILENIQGVFKVIPSNFYIDKKYLKKNKNINFRVIPTDNFNLIQQCPRKFIVGDITENEHREYLNFKKQYINTINKDRLV